MKKFIVILVALIGFGISANAQERYAENNDLLAYTASTSSTTIEILVKANRYVDDLCNYFGGSLLDSGLKIYCKFGGDVYTCTAYRVVQASCTINGAVKLVIEGDMTGALIRLLDKFNPYKAVPMTLSYQAGKYYLSEY